MGLHGAVVLNAMWLCLCPAGCINSRSEGSCLPWNEPKQKSEKVTGNSPQTQSSDEAWVYRKWSRGAQRNRRCCKSDSGYLPGRETEHVVPRAGPAPGQNGSGHTTSNPLRHTVLSCSVALSFCCPGILCYRLSEPTLPMFCYESWQREK